jgi:hypothetical protein
MFERDERETSLNDTIPGGKTVIYQLYTSPLKKQSAKYDGAVTYMISQH